MKIVCKCIFFFFMLCAFAVNAGAQDDLTWPVKRDLMIIDDGSLVDVGDVRIWHTRWNFYVEIIPGVDPNGKPYKIEEAQFWTTNDDSDEAFSAILNKQGRPDPSVAPYKVEFDGGAETYTEERIPVSTFKLCWGTEEKCPLDRYLVVHLEFQGLDDAVYAYEAGNEFKNDKDQVVAWYVTYPFAKVETGHFVDAKVRGLTFQTPTQYGTSGDSGNFYYIPPERVDFWVGSLHLGSATGDHTLSPMDLFEGSDLDDPRVLNVARLLQSLDSNDQPNLIDVTENIPCLETALSGGTEVDFSSDADMDALLTAMSNACPDLILVSKDEARENLEQGQKAANILRGNVSKNPGMKSDKGKIEIMPFYVPAKKADETLTTVVYFDDAGNVIEERGEAKPILVAYEEEVEGTGARDIFVAISRDDGDTWKRRNISKTADKSSKKVYDWTGVATPPEETDVTTLPEIPYPGDSKKPMLNVKDNKIFVAWTDKYCNGGRPAYAITTSADLDCDSNGDGTLDGVLRVTHEGEECVPDYPGDDAYWQDDLYGAGGPQRTVVYDPVEWPEVGEVAYSCVWTARGLIEADGDIVWFKPERLTSGRRDANQLVSFAAEDAGIAVAWQEDPKGLRPPSDYGPGDGWSGANVSNKTDIWYSFIKWEDFDLIDTAYVPPDNGDIVDQDPELAGRVKALVPMSVPVKITDNDVCSAENIAAEGGDGEDSIHHTDEETDPDRTGNGTHRYCGDLESIGTAEVPGSNPLCAYTVEITNHNLETHNVCVTADGRVLDGNTGASRPNLFLQPYMKSDGTKSAYVILGYEESKGVGSPPEEEGEDDEDRYKPDLGKNVIYHSFDFTLPEKVNAGGIINLPETDADGNPVYVMEDTDGDGIGDTEYLDPLGRPVLAYENARRVRFLQQPKGKAGPSKTVLLALYRQGEEGHGKAADVFMRRIVAPKDGNPYAFKNFVAGAQNLSSVTPGETRVYDATDPVTLETRQITKMVNWTWNTGNLSDKSGKEPYSDGLAERGAINGDEVAIAYTWTPNWGRLANDKYDLYVRRSWDGGVTWTTDPLATESIEHTIVFVDPETKEETVTITSYGPGELEPPRNISNLRNNRISVLEPRLVKTPGTIKRPDGTATPYPEDVQKLGTFQVAYGLELNDPEAVTKMPLDIYYGRTTDKGQHYEKVIVTKSDGSGSPEESWNLLAKDKPAQGAAQIKQTPDGSRMYAIWVEESEEGGSDIMFRRVDYRPAAQE